MVEGASWWATPAGRSAFSPSWHELASIAEVPLLHTEVSPFTASTLCEAFAAWCCPDGSPYEQKASELADLRQAAAVLLRYFETDPHAVFAPDIGHAPPVLAVLGCAPPGTKDEGREARRLLMDNYDAHLFLRLLEAAVSHEVSTLLPPARGRRSDEWRHLFVLSVLGVYETMTGKRKAVSKDPGGSKRKGPTPRFLQAYCAHLCAAGAAIGVGVPNKVGDCLTAAAADLSVAGQWVEQARNYQAENIG